MAVGLCLSIEVCIQASFPKGEGRGGLPLEGVILLGSWDDKQDQQRAPPC